MRTLKSETEGRGALKVDTRAWWSEGKESRGILAPFSAKGSYLRHGSYETRKKRIWIATGCRIFIRIRYGIQSEINALLLL